MKNIRFLILFLLSYASFSNFVLRTIANIVVVGVTVNSTSLCDPIRNESKFSTSISVTNENSMDIFCWTESEKSLVRGGFFYGFASTQILCGWLAERYGPKIILGITTFLMVILTYVTPVLTQWNVYALIGSRVAMGALGAALFPSLQQVYVRWAPFSERTIWVFCGGLLGANLGILAAMLAGSIIIDFLGWEYVFYVSAGNGTIWTVLWYFLFTDYPRDHFEMTQEEFAYIHFQRPEPFTQKKAFPPYLKMVTNPGILVLAVCYFATSWTSYLLASEIPLFMHNILNMETSTVGSFICLPLAALCIIGLVASFAADKAIKDHWAKRDWVRKFMETVGTVIPAIALIILGYITFSRELAVTLLTFGFGFTAFALCGHPPVLVAIAPNYPATAQGIVGTLFAPAGFLAPIATNSLTGHDRFDPQGWIHVFAVAASLLLFAMIVFNFCARFSPQSFNYVEAEQEEKHKMKKTEKDDGQEYLDESSLQTKDKPFKMETPLSDPSTEENVPMYRFKVKEPVRENDGFQHRHVSS